jgi:deoxycytidylate deaminase
MNIKYFDILKKIAEDIEPVSRMRLAACLVYKNEIISIGTNRKKSHPFQRKFGRNSDSIFLHAEIDCIINALKRVDEEILEKSILYIQRVKKKDTDSKDFINGIAKPCTGCQKAIAQFKIKDVLYTTDEQTIEYLKEE